MASPHEVLERSIRHPDDSTPESRRAAASRCLQALQTNDYYITRRRKPVTERDDGECPHCGCEWVHVVHGPPFDNAEERMHSDRLRILSLEARIRELEDALAAKAAD